MMTIRFFFLTLEYSVFLEFSSFLSFSRIVSYFLFRNSIIVVEGSPRFLPRMDSDARSENEMKESALQLLLEKDGLSPRHLEPDYLNPTTEINVKLADLGNACWTVCFIVLFVINKYCINF